MTTKEPILKWTEYHDEEKGLKLGLLSAEARHGEYFYRMWRFRSPSVLKRWRCEVSRIVATDTVRERIHIATLEGYSVSEIRAEAEGHARLMMEDNAA